MKTLHDVRLLTLRQWAGLVLLALSTVCYLAVPVIAFLDLGLDEKVGWAGASYGVSLVTWWACLPLLGPELMAIGRAWWRRVRTALRQPADPGR
jgi:hypothetical protein